MKPRVLELIGSFASGGSERQGLQLSKLLSEEGSFDIFVGCLDRSGPLLYENDWLTSKEVPEFKLSSFYDSNFLKQAYRCAEYLRSNQISAVHTHDFYTNIFGMVAGYLARVPVRIASKREIYSKTKLQIRVESGAFRFAHGIVCNSIAVKDFLVESGIPARKTRVIYNGIDSTLFEEAAAGAEVKCSRWETAVPTNSRMVTIVANLRSEVKNHSMFLQSARFVADAVREVEFVIAGEGELLEKLRSEATDLGIGPIVRFIGSCKNVAAVLSISEVCVLSSRSEGFSNAILEYMAAGKPVVATRVGGAAEAIVDGETGFLVESNDAQAMAERIIDLLENPHKAKALGDAGRKRVKELFSKEAQLNKTRELYTELLAKNKTPKG